MNMRTLCPTLAPSGVDQPVPQRVEVAVLGGGTTGLAVAKGLKDRGVHAHVFEADTALGGGMATRGMGMASTLLLDPPFRLVQAVGLSRARDILAFSAEGVEAWGEHLQRTGLVYATKGESESEEVDLNAEAMLQLGVSFTPWACTVTGLSDGWCIPTDGVLNPSEVTRSLAEGLPHSTGVRGVAIDDVGHDLCLRFDDGQQTLADIVVMTGGAQITGWASDKFHPVRHQALATTPVDPLIDQPMHIQYGYTSIRQHPDGAIHLSGCRWATPHLEMGETDDTVISEAVDQRLTAFLHQHWPSLAQTPITHRWTAIMTFTCDGLPILGPLPGRPRIISCGGFGAYSPSFALRAAQAVTNGILTGDSPGVPECFTTRRFD